MSSEAESLLAAAKAILKELDRHIAAAHEKGMAPPIFIGIVDLLEAIKRMESQQAPLPAGTVTEKMVKAALAAQLDVDGGDHHRISNFTMRKYLEAAFAARPAEPVAVKGLLWSKRGDDWYAETHVGQYAVGLVHGSFITMLRGIMDGHMHDLRLEQQPFHSAEEAKASAQADYEQRIRSALISTPAPGLVEALKQSRKLLAWAADSFAAQAKCSKIPDEIDALVGSEVMYRDAAKTVAEALSITETGGAKE
jgi:hypothetical protein